MPVAKRNTAKSERTFQKAVASNALRPWIKTEYDVMSQYRTGYFVIGQNGAFHANGRDRSTPGW